MAQSRNLKDAKRRFRQDTLKNRYSIEDRFLNVCITEYLTYDEALGLLQYVDSLEFICENTDIIKGYLDNEETYKMYI